ncbi:MAG TPA: SRPBCC family protein [Acidimicrobiia bacterium]|nr:SRPBCC family protein [Acidimicrobiia bacterium]
MTRLSDGPTVEVSAQIGAPPGRVWALVTDINISGRFQDEFKAADWLDEGTAVGSRFVGRNANSRFEWETVCTVVEYEENSIFSWVVNDPDDPVATWTFLLQPTEEGTLLTYHRVIGTGPSGLSMAIERHPDREEEIVARRDEVHRAHMQAVVDGIKGLAEE